MFCVSGVSQQDMAGLMKPRAATLLVRTLSEPTLPPYAVASVLVVANVLILAKHCLLAEGTQHCWSL